MDVWKMLENVLGCQTVPSILSYYVELVQLLCAFGSSAYCEMDPVIIEQINIRYLSTNNSN